MRRAAGVLITFVALGALLAVGVATPASAGTPPIVVTTADDVVDGGDGLLSLREAVAVAEVDGVDAAVVLAAHTTYELTICGPEELDAPGPQDNTANGLDHLGPSALRISGDEGTTVEQTCPDAEVVEAEGALTIESLAITGGSHQNDVIYGGSSVRLDGVRVWGNAGAADTYTEWLVFSDGAVEIVDSVIEDNDLEAEGSLDGGWVVWGGPVAVTDSVIRGNEGWIGTVLGNPATITGSEISDNVGRIGTVGSMCDVTISDSTFEGNESFWWEERDDPTGGAVVAVGAVMVSDTAFVGNVTAASGGAVSAAAVRMTGGELAGNVAAERGGAISAVPFDDAGMLDSRPESCGEPPVVLDGSVRLEGVDLSGSAAADGAAIFAEGAITLVDSEVRDSETVTPAPGHDAEQLEGHVVRSWGAVDLAGGTVSGNSTGLGSIVQGASVDVHGTEVSGNTGELGVVLSEGDLDAEAVTVLANSSDVGPLGAVCDVVLVDSVVTGNESVLEDSGGGAVSSSGYVSVTGSELLGNAAAGHGGAIRAETIDMTDSTVAENVADGDGGGLAATLDPNRPETCDAGPPGPRTNQIEITSSTVADNEAGGDGGGVFAVAAVAVDSSTVAANVAGGAGGGVASAFDVVARNSTITSNQAQRGGGIAVAEDDGDGITLGHTTVHANSADVADDLAAHQLQAGWSAIGSPGALGTDCAVGVTSTLGWNVAVDPGCGLDDPTDETTSSLLLGDLVDNGGPTATRMPDAASPVIDGPGAGSCTAALLEDQRGVFRPIGNGCDAGAVESPWVRFRDVSPSHLFFDPITALASDGVIAGFDDDTFRPGATVSRQAAMAFLHRLSGSPVVAVPSPPTFPDVGASHPFLTEIEWAAAEGITEGYADGTFRPSAGVTRQALVAWLYDLVDPTFDPPDTATFADVSSGHPFFAEVEWAASEGIVNGYGDGTFRPGANVTRQAAAAILDRARPLI